MSHSLDDTFDYVKFVDEGFASQTKYGKAAGEKWTPDELKRIDTIYRVSGSAPEIYESFQEAVDHRYKQIITMMGHLMEEMVEARVYVPRRTWKNNEPSYLDNEELRREFVAELFDILLFHRAILAYAGVTGEEFLEAARTKMKYNARRPDHNVNGNVSAEQNPAAELQGDCPSARDLQIYNANGPQHSAGS